MGEMDGHVPFAESSNILKSQNVQLLCCCDCTNLIFRKGYLSTGIYFNNFGPDEDRIDAGWGFVRRSRRGCGEAGYFTLIFFVTSIHFLGVFGVTAMFSNNVITKLLVIKCLWHWNDKMLHKYLATTIVALIVENCPG